MLTVIFASMIGAAFFGGGVGTLGIFAKLYCEYDPKDYPKD